MLLFPLHRRRMLVRLRNILPPSMRHKLLPRRLPPVLLFLRNLRRNSRSSQLLPPPFKAHSSLRLRLLLKLRSRSKRLRSRRKLTYPTLQPCSVCGIR